MMRLPRVSLVFAVVVLFQARVLRADRETDEFNFAEGLFVHKDYLSAVEEFQAFLAGFPNSDRAPLSQFRIGECYMRVDDYQRAAAAFEAALKKYPDSEPAALGSYNLARSRLRLKQTEKALAAFGLAMEKGKGQIREESLVGAGECLIELNRLADAAEIYATLLKEFAKTKHRPSALFSLGWTQAKLNRHKEAVQSFSSLIKEFPDYEGTDKAKLALSDSHAALGNYAESAAVLDEFSGNKGMDEDILLRQAWNQFKSGDKKAAAGTFAAFATTFPKSPLAASALFNAGISHYDVKGYEDAVGLLERVYGEYAAAKEAPDARYWSGLSLFNLGRHPEAVTVMAPLVADAGTLDEDKLDTLHCIYGQALAKSGKHAEAVKQFRAFAKTYPTSRHAGTAAYSLAHALEQLGQLDEAAAILQKLLADLPAGGLRKNALFAAGEYLYRLKRPRDVIPYLEELARAETAEPKVAYRLGWAYFDIGDCEKSLRQFSELARVDSPFTNEALFMCGRSAEKLGNAEGAADHYEKLVAKNATDEFSEKALYHLGFLYKGEKAATNLALYRERFATGQYAPELKLKLAESLFAAGDVAGAQARYGELLAGDVDKTVTTSAHYGMAWCLLKDDKPEEAEKHFAAVIEAGGAPETMLSDSNLQLGEIAYRREQFEAAKGFFDKVTADTKRGERALYMLGWCFRKLGNTADAAGFFRQALDAYPEGEFRSDCALRLSETLNSQGKHDEVRQLLGEAIGKNAKPELEEDMRHEYCSALVEARQWGEVIKQCEALAEKFPGSDRAYLVTFRMGVAHQALDMLDEAEKNFRDTIAKTETIEAARAQFNIGSIYFSREQFLDAAKNFLRVEMLYDYEDLAPKSLHHAVDAFKRAGEDRRADLYRRKLKEKYADSEWAKKAETDGAE